MNNLHVLPDFFESQINNHPQFYLISNINTLFFLKKNLKVNREDHSF